MAIQDATEAERRRARQVRAARNQSLFREVNERIETLQMGWGEPIHIEFVCECYDDACSLPLTMKRVEYAAVRQDSLSFVVLPSTSTRRWKRSWIATRTTGSFARSKPGWRWRSTPIRADVRS